MGVTVEEGQWARSGGFEDKVFGGAGGTMEGNMVVFIGAEAGTTEWSERLCS